MSVHTCTVHIMHIIIQRPLPVTCLVLASSLFALFCTVHLANLTVFLIMTTPRVLVYGGKGALGSAVVNAFKTKNWVQCYTTAQHCVLLVTSSVGLAVLQHTHVASLIVSP